MDRTEQLRELASRWNDAWNSRDAEQLAAFFMPEGTYYEPDLDGKVRGADGIQSVASRTWADWPEVTFEAVSITVEDPRVAVEWRSSARHKSGVELQLEGVDVLTWEGDKIASAQVYYDVHQRRLALGDK